MMRKLIDDFRQVKSNYALYIMLLPFLGLVVVFRYLPMGGIVMAFQNYNIVQGLGKSPFVGLKHFYDMFTDRGFLSALRNTAKEMVSYIGDLYREGLVDPEFATTTDELLGQRVTNDRVGATDTWWWNMKTWEQKAWEESQK
jgi:hypothetical protein